MSNTRQGAARPKFPLGRIYATRSALKLLKRWDQEATAFLERHVQGDWGVVHPDDAAANDMAVARGLRIISSYVVGPAAPGPSPQALWIVTEADRTATTLLLPGEY